MTVSEQDSQAFGSRFRLHYSREYRRFFDQSQIFRLTECAVYRIPNQLNHYRLGMTLKARGTSVERNRVKRVVREFFRRASRGLGSFDYNVVIPNSKRIDYKYSQRLKVSLRGLPLITRERGTVFHVAGNR